MSAAATVDPARNDALCSSAGALRRVADYALPPELDRRLLELGERKDTLTADERADLFAWVAFTQQRSIDTAEARRAFRSLTSVFPELAERP
jgi:hypothetical protein